MKIRKIIVLNLFSFLLICLFFNSKVEAGDFLDEIFAYDASIIVFGENNQEQALKMALLSKALQKKYNNAFKIVSDQKISLQEINEHNLIILNSPSSNKLLDYANQPFVVTNFPVKFNDSFFVFGQRYYGNINDGIVFIYPSFYNPSKYLIVFHSNSLEGLEVLINQHTSFKNHDYQIISSGKSVREGFFDKNNINWEFSGKFDKNYQKPLPFSEELLNLNTANFRFYYFPNSYAAKHIDNISDLLQNYYSKILEKTKYELNHKVSVYLYDLFSDKPISQKSSVNFAAREIYSTYNSEINELLEAFPRYYFQRLNFTNNMAIKEGFVLYAEDLITQNLNSRLNSKMLKEINAETILAIINLQKTDQLSATLMGSFTKYLLNNYGFANYMMILNKAETLNKEEELSNISVGLHVSFSRLVREWKYTLQD